MRTLTALLLSGLLVLAADPVRATADPASTTAEPVSTTAETLSKTDWTIADLMGLLSQQKTRKASFVEKKYIAALEQPLESSGELAFTAPDRLEKRTFKPRPEAVALEGDQVLIERNNGRKLRMSLSERPEVSGFVESIRSTLTGDRAALERFYAMKLTGTAAQWQLSLVPLQPQMVKIISEIRIAGAGDVIATIEFLQADGDRSIMTITDEGAQ